jgi:predicted unusual protein kinase regulating ubiquinone biosynthesis (AarF/ABC1/UbiB family)
LKASLLVQKTMVVVEGVARTLDPDFDMWAAAEPVVADWIERHHGPAGQIEVAAEGVSALGRLVSELPRLADRAGKHARSAGSRRATVPSGARQRIIPHTVAIERASKPPPRPVRTQSHRLLDADDIPMSPRPSSPSPGTGLISSAC